MPKKKKRSSSKSRSPLDPKEKPDASGRSDGSIAPDDSLVFNTIRDMMPDDFAHMTAQDLANLQKFLQSHTPDDLLANSEEVEDEDHDWLDEIDDNYSTLVESRLRELSPPGFFEALEELDELSSVDDADEIDGRLHEILEGCPECGDAWLLLAAFEPSGEQAREHLERALQESKWMLEAARKDARVEDDLVRAYINIGLDVCAEFWKRGLRTEALEVHSELLAVCFEDVGGQRLIYAFRLLEQGWYDELEEQITALQNDAECESGLRLLEAIHHFTKDKESALAREAIIESHAINPQIADYLLGDREREESADEEWLDPEDDEAEWVASIAMAALRSIEGFHRWMRDTLNYSPEPNVPPQQHYQEQLESLREVSQSSDDWILGSKTLDGENFYIAIFVRETEQLVGIVTDDEHPSPRRLWEIVTDAILSPDFGEPLRPGRLFVDSPSLARNWQKRCRSLDIVCLFDSNYSVPDELFDGLHETIQRVESQIELSPETLALASELPESDEVWHAGVFHPPIWINDSATPRRSCVALVIEESSQIIRIHDLTEEQPSESFLAQILLKAMLYPLATELEPCLPAEIKVHPESDAMSIEDLFGTLGIDVSVAEDDSILTDAMEQLIRHCSDASMRESLRESAEMDDLELIRHFQGLARFYRASLWRSIPCDRIIEISGIGEELGTFYAVIIGQISQHRGLVICDEREPLEDIVTGRAPSNECEVTVLNYGEAHEIAPIDLWMIEQLDLDVAGEEGYPMLQRSISKQRFRRPTRSELLAVDVAIRCLPSIAEQPIVDTPISQSVATFLGSVQVNLH